MKKIKLDNLAKFFDTTRQTVARWKKEDNKLGIFKLCLNATGRWILI